MTSPIQVTTKMTMHRGNKRAWLQFNGNHPATTVSGFIANARYNTEFKSDSIILKLHKDGKRKVSNTARGSTLDISSKANAPYNWDNGIVWTFTPDTITIKGA